MSVDDGTPEERAQPKSWLARAKRWLRPTDDAELEERFAVETAARNRRWLLAVTPLVALGHVIHVLVFHIPSSERAQLSAQVVAWRDGVTMVHLVTLLLMLGLAALFLRFGRTRGGRWLGGVAVLLYLLHGAITAYVDQRASPANGVTPFIAYCLFMSFFVTMSPRLALAVYGVAAGAFVFAVLAAQPSPSIRLALLPNGLSIAAVSFALSWISWASRRRDFSLRETIDRQRNALAALNGELEARVNEQVTEIVFRAREVEDLNAQLRAQVRARSSELSLALAKLARQRETDGTLRSGAVLGDRFLIEGVIGEGAMGVVYAGVDRTTHARVAIKVVQATSTRQLDGLHRFLREARASATIAHPAIVRALHVDVSDDGMLFQVQELIEGETVERWHAAGSPWDPAEVARLVAVVAGALAAAHAGGVIHRDVKPANVMLVDTSPGAKLLDFGIAKLYENPYASEDSSGTRTGAMLGTPAFMSPEQIDGVRDVTAAADVYALGIMMFVLLSGRFPFDDGTTLHGVVYGHLCVEPPDVRTLAEAVPASLAALVSRALSKAPEDRPSAAEVAKSAETIADEAGAPALEEIVRSGTRARSGTTKSPLARTMVR